MTKSHARRPAAGAASAGRSPSGSARRRTRRGRSTWTRPPCLDPGHPAAGRSRRVAGTPPTRPSPSGPPTWPRRPAPSPAGSTTPPCSGDALPRHRTRPPPPGLIAPTWRPPSSGSATAVRRFLAAGTGGRDRQRLLPPGPRPGPRLPAVRDGEGGHRGADPRARGGARRRGIRVNAVAPARSATSATPTSSPRSAEAPPRVERRDGASCTRSAGLGDPDEVAAVIAHLLSDDGGLRQRRRRCRWTAAGPSSAGAGAIAPPQPAGWCERVEAGDLPRRRMVGESASSLAGRAPAGAAR